MKSLKATLAIGLLSLGFNVGRVEAQEGLVSGRQADTAVQIGKDAAKLTGNLLEWGYEDAAQFYSDRAVKAVVSCREGYILSSCRKELKKLVDYTDIITVELQKAGVINKY